jgi:hypothetical protein
MRATALSVLLLAVFGATDAIARPGDYQRCCFAVEAKATAKLAQDFGDDISRGFAGSASHEWSWRFRDLYVYGEQGGRPIVDSINGGARYPLTRSRATYKANERTWAYGEWQPECNYDYSAPRDGTGWFRDRQGSTRLEFSRGSDRRLYLRVQVPEIVWSNDCPRPIGDGFVTLGRYFAPDPDRLGPHAALLVPPRRSLFHRTKVFDATAEATAQCYGNCGDWTVSGAYNIVVKFTWFSAANLDRWIARLRNLPS